VILNVQAEQITGTRWFDISYEIRDPDSAVVSVSLKISAIEGWEFLGWSGDYVGLDPKLSWEVKAPAHLVATFGTTLNTVATGGGKIALEPAMKVYPYGSKVRVMTIPDLGYGLSLWGGAGVGQTQNEWTLTITNARPKTRPSSAQSSSRVLSRND